MGKKKQLERIATFKPVLKPGENLKKMADPMPKPIKKPRKITNQTLN